MWWHKYRSRVSPWRTLMRTRSFANSHSKPPRRSRPRRTTTTSASSSCRRSLAASRLSCGCVRLCVRTHARGGAETVGRLRGYSQCQGLHSLSLTSASGLPERIRRQYTARMQVHHQKSNDTTVAVSIAVYVYVVLTALPPPHRRRPPTPTGRRRSSPGFQRPRPPGPPSAPAPRPRAPRRPRRRR